MPIAPEKVIGVMVTYKPDVDTLNDRIEAHLKQFTKLIVIENGVEKVSVSLKKSQSLIVLAHADNNLAAAQNLGIRSARELGAQAILLLDDDGDLSKGALQALCDAYTNADGLVAPQTLISGVPTRHAVPWLGFLFQKKLAVIGSPISNSFTPIASGSLIFVRVLDEVGLMDESFGIDYVDREFCLRLMTRGYAPKVIAEAELTHQLGSTQNKAMGVQVRHHSAARRRSIFRNRLRCWARYGLCVPSFLFYDMLAAIYDIARIVIYEKAKREKLTAIVKGVMDAILRR